MRQLSSILVMAVSVLLVLDKTYICNSEVAFSNRSILSAVSIDCYEFPFNKELKCLEPFKKDFFDFENLSEVEVIQ